MAYDEGLVQRIREAMVVPHAREFAITGRSMRGWVVVCLSGYLQDSYLKQWVDWGLDFAASFSPK